MNIIAIVIPRAQAFELMDQRLGLLGHIPHLAQPAAMLGATPGQMRLNAAASQLVTMGFAVVSAVGVEGPGATTRASDLASHRRDGINERNQLRHIMTVGGGDGGGQRRAAPVGQHMMFGAVFTAVDGAGSRFFPPRTARTEAESTVARDQSN